MKVFVLLLSAMFLAGCNTLEGLGKDIQRGGEELQKAARK